MKCFSKNGTTLSGTSQVIYRYWHNSISLRKLKRPLTRCWRWILSRPTTHSPTWCLHMRRLANLKEYWSWRKWLLMSIVLSRQSIGLTRFWWPMLKISSQSLHTTSWEKWKRYKKWSLTLSHIQRWFKATKMWMTSKLAGNCSNCVIRGLSLAWMSMSSY